MDQFIQKRKNNIYTLLGAVFLIVAVFILDAINFPLPFFYGRTNDVIEFFALYSAIVMALAVISLFLNPIVLFMWKNFSMIYIPFAFIFTVTARKGGFIDEYQILSFVFPVLFSICSIALFIAAQLKCKNVKNKNWKLSKRPAVWIFGGALLLLALPSLLEEFDIPLFNSLFFVLILLELLILSVILTFLSLKIFSIWWKLSIVYLLLAQGILSLSEQGYGSGDVDVILPFWLSLLFILLSILLFIIVSLRERKK